MFISTRLFLLVLFTCSTTTLHSLRIRHVEGFPLLIPNSPRDFQIPQLLDPDASHSNSETTPILESLRTNLNANTATRVASVSSGSAGGASQHPKSTSKDSSLATAELPTNSITGSLSQATAQSTPPQPTISSTGTSSTTSTTPATASIPPDGTRGAGSMPPGEERKWQVIGIGVIVIAFAATVILVAVFFDSWWGFLRDLCGRRKHAGTEDIVPDWVERNWQFKLSNEDGHRYPTLESLESITQSEKHACDVPAARPTALNKDSTLHTPAMHSAPDLDPHPLEPLFRRPSIRTPSIKSPNFLPYR